MPGIPCTRLPFLSIHKTRRYSARVRSFGIDESLLHRQGHRHLEPWGQPPKSDLALPLERRDRAKGWTFTAHAKRLMIVDRSCCGRTKPGVHKVSRSWSDTYQTTPFKKLKPINCKIRRQRALSVNYVERHLLWKRKGCALPIFAAPILTETLKAGAWFGFAKVGIEIPKSLWLRFEEMPPFLFTKQIPDEALPQCMKDYWERNDRTRG